MRSGVFAPSLSISNTAKVVKDIRQGNEGMPMSGKSHHAFDYQQQLRLGHFHP